MPVPSDFYTPANWQTEAGGLNCTLSFNAAHAIFDGHFPGNPIVPGVCTMQIILDLLQHAVQKKLRLVQAANIKFLQLITPDLKPIVTVAWTISGNAYTANATLKDGAATLFKMNAVYAAAD